MHTKFDTLSIPDGTELNINLPRERLDHVLHGEVKSNGSVSGGHSTNSGTVRTVGTVETNAQGGFSIAVDGDASITDYGYGAQGVEALEQAGTYPPELLELAGLTVNYQELADEYFYDKTTTLSPAFSLALGIALNFVVPGTGFFAGSGAISSAANAALSGVIKSAVEGAITGNFDIGNVLKSAVVSGVTGGISQGVNLDNVLSTLGADGVFEGGVFDQALLGIGGEHLSLNKLLDQAFSTTLSTGISSAAYGTDFFDSLGTALVNVAAAQVSAGLQHEIGDLAANAGGLFDEGAPIHTVLHGLVGCAAGQVTSGSCAGGAAAGAAQSLYAGFTDALNDGQEDGGLTKEQVELQTEIAGIIGGISAVLATGDVNNLQLGQGIAQSGFTNNFLKHAEALRLEVLKQQLKDCEAADCATIAAEITALEELDIERKNKLETCGTTLVKICTDEIFQSFAAGSDWVNTDLRNDNIEEYASDLNPEVLVNILNNILPQHFDDLISQQTDAVISYNDYTIDDILNSTDNNRISLSLPVRLNSNGKAVITSPFGRRAKPTSKASSFHTATDFRAPMGADILATQDGLVEDLTPQSNGGNVVIIRNSDGSRSGYGHTAPNPGMKVGDSVQAGDVIGISDGSGTGSAPHQHYTYTPPDSSIKVDPMQTQLQPLQKDTCQLGTSSC